MNIRKAIEVPVNDDDWIPHDSPVCPIPWAKAGEFVVACRGVSMRDAIEWDWRLIKGYKLMVPMPPEPRKAQHIEEIIRQGLREAREEAVAFGDAPDYVTLADYQKEHPCTCAATHAPCPSCETIKEGQGENYWIPVKGDGTIPRAIRDCKAGEWEYRTRSFCRPYISIYCPQEVRSKFLHEYVAQDIVAVRPILPIPKKVPHDDIPDLSEAELEKIVKEFGGKVTLYERDTKVNSNRAYLRFRNSPRGKEALARIGKGDTPTPALGETAMLRIFNEALNIFEAEIERKRG